MGHLTDVNGARQATQGQSPKGLVMTSESVTTQQVHRPSILCPSVAVVNLESPDIKSQLTHSPKLLPEAGGGAALAGHTREAKAIQA